MTEVILKATLHTQNLPLKMLLKKHGLTARELSRRTGVCYITLQDIINLRLSSNNPIVARGGYKGKKTALCKIADFFGCSIYEIYPDDYCEIAKRKNKTKIKKELVVESNRVLYALDRQREIESGFSFTDYIDSSVDNENLLNALETLPQRERTVLEKLYFQDETLEEVGEEFSVSRERIRQLENKALRKIRRYAPELKTLLS